MQYRKNSTAFGLVLKKLKVKTEVTVKIFLATLLSKLDFIGAKPCGFERNGTMYLALNRNYLLGPKNTVIRIPKDEVIYKSVRRFGQWETSESIFLGEGLRRIGKNSNLTPKIIDIGANAGLISIQAINYANFACELYAIEPLLINHVCLTSNLEVIRAKSTIFKFQKALSDRDSTSNIYVNRLNLGDSSLIFKNTVGMDIFESTVETVSTKEFFQKNIPKSGRFVFKCDIQGYESLVISHIPMDFWDLVDCALIEVGANSTVTYDQLSKIELVLQKFSKLQWSSETSKSIKINEVINFWRSNSDHERNLFLSK